MNPLAKATDESPDSPIDIGERTTEAWGCRLSFVPLRPE
ncbi:hypothetical protein F652_1792 [Enterobacteriaceae bacterium bta3-1]|nr:hypothetical protein F652_1792 [Enterobacteriaceae bacterium bta3-1]